MARYSDITFDDAKKLVKRYGLKLNSMSYLSGGAANTSYLLNDNNVLTILDNHESIDPSKMVHLHEILIKKEINVPQVLEDKEGKKIQDFKGVPTILKNYIPGEILSDTNRKVLHELGKIIARINLITVPKNFSVGQGRRLPDNWISKINSAPNALFEEIREAEVKFDNVQNHCELPQGLVHGDIFSDNVLINDNNCISILDWETASYDIIIFDIGVSIIGICKNLDKIDLQKTKAIISGYQQIRPLSESEILQLPIVTRYANAVLMYHRFYRHNILHPDPKKKESFRDLLKLSDSINSIEF